MYVRKYISGDRRVHRDNARRHGMVTKWADLHLAKEWLAKCLQEHDGCTPANTVKAPFHPSTRFIDVEQQRLVSISDTYDADYVALSYVWGGPQPQRTVTTNLEMYEKSLPYDGLPKTIQDAMVVTQTLGYRYLWVDALCIVQDSPEIVAIQIQQMNAVYKRAIFTLVNAGGTSAESGLHGVSFSRQCDEVPLPNGIALGRWNEGSHGQGFNQFSTYGTRGWTLQEQLLSGRKLIFDDLRIVWECDTHTLPESGSARPGFVTDLRGALCINQDLSVPRDLDPEAFEDAWQATKVNFSRRNLTDIRDRLHAITGIIEELKVITGDEYVQGHNSAKLYQDLLWVTDYVPSQDLSGSPYDATASDLAIDRRGPFPTWSWLSLWPIEWGTTPLGSEYRYRPVARDKFFPLPQTSLKIQQNRAGLWELEIFGPLLHLRLTGVGINRTYKLYFPDGRPLPPGLIERLTYDQELAQRPNTLYCVPLAKVYRGVWKFSTLTEEERWLTGALLLRNVDNGNHYVRFGVALLKGNHELYGRERRRITCQ
ncbi:heterokaryon incompatibility protein-domain-containing protein [Sphaerosporella brunnea]|uniref:Heterokaryon incompatibility protein-domain-containing protein n=1 Tax=Sphaerosporella brunnea TaxID=1250544 RepID=A0A5J5F3I8_9PEZI|nr:heterokaryon incompatibility protein-domain-containing protein [Sphaerosporella brunnea]